MDPRSFERRDFIKTSGSAIGGAWALRFAPLLAAAQACARDVQENGGGFTVFTEREAADFEALAARIVPSDDGPGAREANVVVFADRALGTFLADLLPIVREGLTGLAARVAADPEGPTTFSALPEADQDLRVAEVERDDPNFFYFARVLVVLGLVSNPEYGGNQDRVGWELIGFEGTYAYQPPFGFYDRGEHAGPGAAQ